MRRRDGGSTDLARQRERPSLMPDRLRLVLLSFLLLFVELALIRWTGENVVYLSYFSNFVLLGSFLGIGRRRVERLARQKTGSGNGLRASQIVGGQPLLCGDLVAYRLG